MLPKANAHRGMERRIRVVFDATIELASHRIARGHRTLDGLCAPIVEGDDDAIGRDAIADGLSRLPRSDCRNKAVLHEQVHMSFQDKPLEARRLCKISDRHGGSGGAQDFPRAKGLELAEKSEYSLIFKL
jgi:hypothetical protein